MKISKLQKFAWVFLALALGTTSLFAQGWRNGNRTFVQNNQEIYCVEVLTNLTDDQVSSITELEDKHQETMDELRNQRRSTVDLDEKDKIRENMLENVVAHRSEVKNLLTEEQQKEYELLQLRGNKFRNQRAINQRGNRSSLGNGRQGFTGSSRGGWRGNGNGAGFRQENNRQNHRGYPRNNNRGRGFRGIGYQNNSDNS